MEYDDMREEAEKKFREKKRSLSNPTLKEIEKELEELKEMVMQSGASDYTKTDAKMAARFLPSSLENAMRQDLLKPYRKTILRLP